MKKLKINNLIIELTRKCTMNCDHCLRGEQQDMQIQLDTSFYHTLSNIEYINQITFTGGEPLLEADKIISILHRIIKM